MLSDKRQDEVFSIVPNHGSKEVATGTALHILKTAGLK